MDTNTNYFDTRALRLRHRYFVNGKHVELSLVGGAMLYSLPRAYLPNLEDYQAVEVGLIIDGELRRPSKLHTSLKKYNHLWEPGNGSVGPYIDMATVRDLMADLASLEKKERSNDI